MSDAVCGMRHYLPCVESSSYTYSSETSSAELHYILVLIPRRFVVPLFFDLCWQRGEGKGCLVYNTYLLHFVCHFSRFYFMRFATEFLRLSSHMFNVHCSIFLLLLILPFSFLQSVVSLRVRSILPSRATMSRESHLSPWHRLPSGVNNQLTKNHRKATRHSSAFKYSKHSTLPDIELSTTEHL